MGSGIYFSNSLLLLSLWVCFSHDQLDSYSHIVSSSQLSHSVVGQLAFFTFKPEDGNGQPPTY